LAITSGGSHSLALLQNPAASTLDHPQLLENADAEADSVRFGKQASRTHAVVSDKLRAGSDVSGIKGEPDLLPRSINTDRRKQEGRAKKTRPWHQQHVRYATLTLRQIRASNFSLVCCTLCRQKGAVAVMKRHRRRISAVTIYLHLDCTKSK
jgi:hypothetical protein